MQRNSTILIYFLGTLMLSCSSDITRFDATGTFEATEVIISSESIGKIISFEAVEGTQLKKGQLVVQIDTLNLDLQKQQIEASIDAVSLKQHDAQPQIEIHKQQLVSATAQIKMLQTQLKNLQKEQTRINKLFLAQAATEQKHDDINGKVDVMQEQIIASVAQKKVIEAQITSARRSVAIQNRGITSAISPLEKKIALLEDQQLKATVINPVSGTILTKYAYEGEFVSMGKPLYKIADLTTMNLRAYVDGNQLSYLKLNQKVDVYIDQGKDDYKAYSGSIIWISDQAEFTPKTIQTKDERANLVYAIKIKVLNDGYLKIGMYGEVDLLNPNESQNQ